MIVNIGALFCLLTIFPSAYPQEQAEHREFQYNSVVDPATGRYNFAYDTGNDNEIAHSMHMQYQDADGIVRGRYGYTDPNGKLRMVEYEAGPNGFVARGDVGPDGSLHNDAPASTSPENAQPVLASYNENTGDDLDLDPAPVQMAGWDPEVDPMKQVQPTDGSPAADSVIESENSIGNEYGLDPSNQYTTVNVTSYNALELYGPELGFYTDRYPRLIYSLNEGNTGRKRTNLENQNNETEVHSQVVHENNTLNVFKTDDLDSVQVEAKKRPVRRSVNGDGNQTRTISSETGIADENDNRNQTEIVSETDDLAVQHTDHQYVRVPYPYRRYYDHRDIHNHHAEEVSKHDHDHYNDKYYVTRQNHDHDAEQNKQRQTHDHDPEKYLLTHEKAVEDYKTHNHTSGTNYEHAAVKYRFHDHAVERAAHLRRIPYYHGPRMVFYRDSHSMQPHEHYGNPVYRNYRDHQHSDVQLYGRHHNYVYPVPEKLSDVRYVPSRRYYNNAYYWRHK